MNRMEQLLAFCDWERKHNPHPEGKPHVAEWAAAEIERLNGEVALLRATMEGATYQLSKARIWGGMEWHYNPLHPMHYRPALDRLREVLDGPNVAIKPRRQASA